MRSIEPKKLFFGAVALSIALFGVPFLVFFLKIFAGLFVGSYGERQLYMDFTFTRDLIWLMVLGLGTALPPIALYLKPALRPLLTRLASQILPSKTPLKLSHKSNEFFAQELVFAEKGNLEAQIRVAAAYYDDKKFNQAFVWYLKAAEQGAAEAQFQVAEMYRLGIGVAKMLSEALKYYHLAAKQGLPAAQQRLVMLEPKDLSVSYLGVPKNIAKAETVRRDETENQPIHNGYDIAGLCFGKTIVQSLRKRGLLSAKPVLSLLCIGVIVVLATALLLIKIPTKGAGLLIARLLVDFVGNVAVWLLILCFVAFVIAKILKAQSTKPYLRKAAWAALAISILATIPRVERDFKLLFAQPPTARFEQIIKGVMQDESFRTAQVHQEFWSMLTVGGASVAQIRDLRDKMTGMLTVYQPVFWQDALESLRTGQPYKSVQREDYEKNLLAKGMITIERIRANDVTMAKIAAREAITRDGQSIVFNEDMIEPMLATIQQVVKRVDQLFTPPQK